MASDYLLELDGVKGESKDRIHKGSIELDSWSFGASNASGNPEGADFKEFHFTTKVNKASPQLLLKCCSGKHIPKATLFIRKTASDTVDYYKVMMQDCLVSSFQASAGGGDLPTDEFALNFAQVEVIYTPTAGPPLTTGVQQDIRDDDGSGVP